MKHYIEENYEAFEDLGSSTNRVRRFDYAGAEYIIKTQILENTTHSLFWHMMNDVFELDFERMRRHSADVYALLKDNPHMPTARPVTFDQARRYIVYEQMQGEQWIPDSFPEDAEVCRQLGRFVGYNHTHSFDSCGVVGRLGVENVKARLIKHCRGRAADTVGDCELGRLCDRAAADRDHPSRYTLIMTDISANQFLFGKHSIRACVDTDAYVVGPAEWELAVLRNCVPDFKSFAQGYEEYLPLPEDDEVSRLFGYIME